MDPIAWIILGTSTVGWLLSIGVAWQRLRHVEKDGEDREFRIRKLERFRWSHSRCLKTEEE